MAGLLAMLAMMNARLPPAAAHLDPDATRSRSSCWCSCSCRASARSSAGSARWLKIGPLPAVHPAEFAKLALVIYLAHWLAKRGTGIRGLLSGTIPFLIIFLPIVALVLKEPDLGTSMVLASPG